MNALTKAAPPPGTLAIPEDEAIRVLGNSLYPGAKPESIRLVLAWCRATGRDPMKKPIHIVPMWVKDAATGQGGMRDVLMPGIGTYRTDAATSGAYAGKSEPEFGPDVNGTVGNVKMTYPKWCKVTVERIVGGQVRKFTALEFWLENYATAGKDKATGQPSDAPNTMWRKRPYGQLAKCAEAQALRMAFPDETGNTNTQEEMEGKTFDGMTIDAEPAPAAKPIPSPPPVSENVAPPPKRRTAREFLNELHSAVAACHTIDEVDAIANSDGVQAALKFYSTKTGSDEVDKRNKTMLDELNALLAAAIHRTQTDPDPGTADSVIADAEDDFPGDK